MAEEKKEQPAPESRPCQGCGAPACQSRSEHLPGQFIVSIHCPYCGRRDTLKGLRLADDSPVPKVLPAVARPDDRRS